MSPHEVLLIDYEDADFSFIYVISSAETILRGTDNAMDIGLYIGPRHWVVVRTKFTDAAFSIHLLYCIFWLGVV